MAKVIIPREYILGGTGFEAEKDKDKAIDVKDILSIDRIFARDKKDYTSIEYLSSNSGNFINVDLKVFEVCAMIADALKG